MLQALQLAPGDEVITSPYTFSATAASILYAGGTPVLADTLADWPNLDPANVRSKVSSRTKAILPVHFAGAPCDMDALMDIGRTTGATVLEDAAHALPASYKGMRVGTISRATAFSFYAGKNMTTGEGGMITTDDASLAEDVRMRRLHGISRDAWKRYSAEGSWYYEVSRFGFKYNMTDINAAMGLHQLDRLEGFHRRRVALVALYDELLQGVPGVLRPQPPAEGECSWHLYVVRVDPEIRDKVIEMLKADNIGTSVHFIPIHHHPFYQERLGCKESDYPNATRLFRGAISLPLFPCMREDDVRNVARSLERAVTESMG
jgi:dTDP-4-amino-4,6-dideoxygalactose transaminase